MDRREGVKIARASTEVAVAALYRFAAIDDAAGLREALFSLCQDLHIRGTLIVADEGINGTVAGERAALIRLIDRVRVIQGCDGLDVKWSSAPAQPFHRLKVHHKREIVTFGVEGIDPLGAAGTYVSPQEWDALITDPETLVIDTRNTYETRIGTFAGAVDPGTASFREFPAWFRANRESLLAGKRRVAMFCTGGIRCEKSTAFLKDEGIEDVYHLRGGILRYLEDVPAEGSTWLGECFVFDQRVAVGHGLAAGSHGRCHACREPLTVEEMQSPLYVEGEQCQYCAASRTSQQRSAAAERHRQQTLAESRGESHVGAHRPNSSNHVGAELRP